MKTGIKLLFILAFFLIAGCDDSESESEPPSYDDAGTPELAAGHAGWQDNDCMACHVEGNDEGAPLPHDDLPIPQCANCHGANGAYARPEVTWHPDGSCADYNCHGTMHTYTDVNDCNQCHFASAGVVPGTDYH